MSSILYTSSLCIRCLLFTYTLASELVEVLVTLTTSASAKLSFNSWSSILSAEKTSKNVISYSQLSSSSLSTSRSLSSSTFFTISPCFMSTPQPSPPAIPISASLASPGPLTTQPITAIFIFRLLYDAASVST